MTEILRDSIWTFIGAVLALAAILVSWAVYLAQKQRKRITVETLARVPLIAFGKEGITGLEITFNGEALERATIVLIRVTNAGNTPILSADFEAPLSFEFATGAKILSASIVASEPERMPVTASFTAGLVTLSPHLLNPTDNLTCRVLLPASDTKYQSLGRIVGVKKIEGTRRVSLAQPAVSLLGMVAAAGAFWLSPEPKSARISELRLEEMPFLAVIASGFLFALIVNSVDLRARVNRRREQRRLLHGDEG